MVAEKWSNDENDKPSHPGGVRTTPQRTRFRDVQHATNNYGYSLS